MFNRAERVNVSNAILSLSVIVGGDMSNKVEILGRLCLTDEEAIEASRNLGLDERLWNTDI